MKKRKTYNSVDEWEKEGERLFGKNHLTWKFVCPSCGHIQTMQDFKDITNDYPDLNPETAFFSCIGRWSGHFENSMCSGKSPCNYTNGGLFNLAPIEIIDDGGVVHYAFDFASMENES